MNHSRGQAVAAMPTQQRLGFNSRYGLPYRVLNTAVCSTSRPRKRPARASSGDGRFRCCLFAT